MRRPPASVALDCPDGFALYALRIFVSGRAMMRTLRSKRLRAALWIAAQGRCQHCGRPLPSNWHGDHVVAYSKTKRTNVHEMQALCPECNRKKGAA
jgi:5-methylcytosine-specific restriction endonuclease McrA